MKEVYQRVEALLGSVDDQGEAIDKEKAGELIFLLAEDGSAESLSHCQALVTAIEGDFDTRFGRNDSDRFFKHGLLNKKAIHFAAENENYAWCALLAPFFDVYMFEEEGVSVCWCETDYEGDDETCTYIELDSRSGTDRYFHQTPPGGDKARSFWSYSTERSESAPSRITRFSTDFSALGRAVGLGFEKNIQALLAGGKYNKSHHRSIARNPYGLSGDAWALLREKSASYEREVKARQEKVAAEQAARWRAEQERTRAETDRRRAVAEARRAEDEARRAAAERAKITSENTKLEKVIGFLYRKNPVDRSLLPEAVREFGADGLLKIVVRQIDLRDEDNVRIYCQMMDDLVQVYQERAFKGVQVNDFDSIINTLWGLYSAAEGDSKARLSATLHSTLRFAVFKRHSPHQVLDGTGQSLFYRACAGNDRDMSVILIDEFGFGLFGDTPDEGLFPIEAVTNPGLFQQLIGNNKWVKASFAKRYSSPAKHDFLGNMVANIKGKSVSVESGCQLISAVIPVMDSVRQYREVNIGETLQALFGLTCEASGESKVSLLQVFQESLRYAKSRRFDVDSVLDSAGKTLLARACEASDGVMVDLLVDIARAAASRAIQYATNEVIFDKLLRQVPKGEQGKATLAFKRRVHQLTEVSDKQAAEQSAQPSFSHQHYGLISALYTIIRQHSAFGSFNSVPISDTLMMLKVQQKPNSRTAKLFQLVRVMLADPSKELSDQQVRGLGGVIVNLPKCRRLMAEAIKDYMKLVPALNATTADDREVAGQGGGGGRPRLPSTNPDYPGSPSSSGDGQGGGERPLSVNPAWDGNLLVEGVRGGGRDAGHASPLPGGPGGVCR